MRRNILISSGLVLATLGCGPGSGTYCQTGSKYGTQCYAEPDVTSPPGSHPEPTEHPPKGERPRGTGGAPVSW
jgi:hypothetical protein